MPNEKVKVLYLAGQGRSGSTIVGNVLGQIPGFFAAGELRHIWERSFLENRPCGCGQPFRDCPVWQSIFQQAFGGGERIDAEKMIRYRHTYTRNRQIFTQGAGVKWESNPEWDEYLEVLDALYRAITSVTGNRVIIDSSKYPRYASTLQATASLDTYILHLVRDPRGVSYSNFKRYKRARSRGRRPKIYQHPWLSPVAWNVINRAVAKFKDQVPTRYLSVTYEAFIEKPKDALTDIFNFLDEEISPSQLGFIDGHRVELSPTHTVGGNANRHTTGSIVLRQDTEWRDELPLLHRVIVDCVTYLARRQYAYT